MKVLSLGWGVQSFTLAAMSALGEIDMIDAAIHADTTNERSGTYTHAEKWTPWLEEHGVKVVTVKGNRSSPVKYGGVFIPAYTFNGKKKGRLRRQCTKDWKIAPIRRWLQANRNKEPVELFLGISTDEALRMKMSDVKYVNNRWPLIELRMSRNDCANWLKEHSLDVPLRSACVFCPNHNTRSWQEMKENDIGDWHRAVEVESAIRKVRPPFDLFLHPARIPLVDIDFRTEEEKGQLQLWDEECSGMCGV